MTPCERLGYKVGDKFVVSYPNDEEDRPFSEGAIVSLFEDDESSCPLFLLIEGACLYDNAGGNPGAFELIDYITPLGNQESST
jgi:hypothetical protein